MDEDERERREALVATTMERVWSLVEQLKGEWTFDTEDTFDDIRSHLCRGLGVDEDAVIRREG